MNDVNVFSTFGRCCLNCCFVHLRWQKPIPLQNWNAARTAPVLGGILFFIPPSFLFNLFLLLLFSQHRVFYSDIKRCWWCPDVAHRPWSDGFPDLTSPFPSPHPVAHRRCKSDEGTDHLLDSSFVSICRVWFIPSSDLVFPVKTVHRRRREGKKTQFIMCVHFFFLFWLLRWIISRGGSFSFFSSPWCDTHTLCSLGWFW